MPAGGGGRTATGEDIIEEGERVSLSVRRARHVQLAAERLEVDRRARRHQQLTREPCAAHVHLLVRSAVADEHARAGAPVGAARERAARPQRQPTREHAPTGERDAERESGLRGERGSLRKPHDGNARGRQAVGQQSEDGGVHLLACVCYATCVLREHAC
jgi:hypothetical protein